MIDEGTEMATGKARRVPTELLALLVCPVDKAVLREEVSVLVCTECDRRYPVDDGIPNMLVDE
jgi:uncharacterized protein YbaR (Trm112 family)